jgi:hypothetical protein
MSEMLSQLLRFGLSVSTMDRELFVSKVSSLLEMYRNDPETMEKISQQLYQYLTDVKSQMDLQNAISQAIGNNEMPTAKDVNELTQAIEKLTQELQKNNSGS